MKEKTAPLTYKDGEAMARKIGASAYMECSSKNIQNLDKVIEAAVALARPEFTAPAPVPKKNCVLQ